MLAGPISKTGSGFFQTGVKGLKGASQEPKKIRFDSAAQLPSHPKWTPKLDLYQKQTQLKKQDGIARMTRLRTLGRCSQIPTPKKKEILAPREDPHQAVFKGVVASFSSASLPSKPRCTIVQIAGQTTLQAFQTGRKAACTIVDSLAEGFPSPSMDRPKLACAIGVVAYGSRLSTARAWRNNCPKQSVCLGPAGTLQVAKLQTSRRFEERHPDFCKFLKSCADAQGWGREHFFVSACVLQLFKSFLRIFSGSAYLP